MKQALVAIFAIACGTASLSTPFTITAPPQYRQWYIETEVCSGLTGDYEALNFAVQDSIVPANKQHLNGFYEPLSHTIVVRSDLRMNRTLIVHEEMHSLLKHGGHPELYFKVLCGDLDDIH